MMQWLNDFIGTSTDLTLTQMAIRTTIVFFVTMFFLRIAGRRSFSQKNAFDICLTVLLGAILSRAVVGASPFIPTLGAGATIVSLYRVIALLSVYSSTFDRFINGVERFIINDSMKDQRQMRASLITEKDLEEAIRKKLGVLNWQFVKQAVLERNGEITIVPKDNSR